MITLDEYRHILNGTMMPENSLMIWTRDSPWWWARPEITNEHHTMRIKHGRIIFFSSDVGKVGFNGATIFIMSENASLDAVRRVEVPINRVRKRPPFWWRR